MLFPWTGFTFRCREWVRRSEGLRKIRRTEWSAQGWPLLGLRKPGQCSDARLPLGRRAMRGSPDGHEGRSTVLKASAARPFQIRTTAVAMYSFTSRCGASGTEGTLRRTRINRGPKPDQRDGRRRSTLVILLAGSFQTTWRKKNPAGAAGRCCPVGSFAYQKMIVTALRRTTLAAIPVDPPVVGHWLVFGGGEKSPQCVSGCVSSSFALQVRYAKPTSAADAAVKPRSCVCDFCQRRLRAQLADGEAPAVP